ncbi:MAG TPA: ABC transporter permease [Candidatus Dormibacteraeota bacterium]|jgi:predicted permease|nr:ABC transporter permease [Candidatus Dormibacteraeota bacterium]
MSILARDLRYAFRAFGRSPGFAVAAILSLAIGIGANTAIFSITSALLLRPLPYKDADRLVIMWNTSPGLGITQDWFSSAQYFDIRNNHHGLEQVALAIGGNYNITGEGEPERVGVVRVSNNMLPMLGARPAQGRLFTPEDDRYGGPNVVILGYGIWARRYASNPQMVGRHITINSHVYEVIGVLPKDFSLPREVMPTLDGAEQSDLLLPMPQLPNLAEDRGHEDYNIIAKLRPGVTVEQARAEMDTITARLRQAHPEVYPPNGGLTFVILPLLEQVVGNVRHTLWLLLAAVGCVLLIACVNVANLLLSRAVGRQREVAIRSAVGASTGRIIRQLLTESVVLALCGGVLGVLFAFISIHWTHVLGPRSVPRLDEIGVRGDALLFTLLISVASGVLFGLAPALRVARVDLLTTLKDSDRGSAGASAMWGRGNNLRRLLVIAELAISVVVLIVAGLLLRSFVRLQHVSPGFNPGNVLTLELTLSGDKYKDPAVARSACRRILENLEHLPGATSAGGVSSLPLSDMFAWGPINVEGRVPPPGEKFINADERVVAGHYFETMQIPLIKGRLFNDQDTVDKPHVVLVDEFMAQQLWPNQDPLGKRISFGDLAAKPEWVTVVGVVGRIKQDALDSDSRIALYIPHSQYITRLFNIVLRTTTDPASLTSAVAHELHEVDRDLPMYGVVTMEQRVAGSLARRRFTTVLLAMFAGFALALATIGIYGVMAYLVSQGTREIGIRIALGATQRTVLKLVVKQGMVLAVCGVAVGLIAALAFSRLVSGLLFGVKTTDPLTFVAITILLTVVALVASYIPARRAARIDPMISLRCE